MVQRSDQEPTAQLAEQSCGGLWLTVFKKRYALKYTFDIYNLTNTSSFDVPGNEVSQNENYNSFPTEGTTLYNAPFGLGVVTHTIGSPRQIQMSLGLTF